MKRRIYIGTSGWMYKDWGKRFYPHDLTKDHIVFYASQFPTVELNASFYRMPSEQMFASWKQKTPNSFVFSVKLSRYITHRKRLIVDKQSSSYLRAFIEHAHNLGKKLAVILIQLPPSFKKDIDRLGTFLESYSNILTATGSAAKTAIEFRHQSWFSQDVYGLLKAHRISFVISSTPDYRRIVFTSGFSYVRMHGGEVHDYRYLNKDLKMLAQEIDRFPSSIRSVFIYFNNDYSAYAIDNARYLRSLLERKRK